VRLRLAIGIAVSRLRMLRNPGSRHCLRKPGLERKAQDFVWVFKKCSMTMLCGVEAVMSLTPEDVDREQAWLLPTPLQTRQVQPEGPFII
jgi:hypothetical protein